MLQLIAINQILLMYIILSALHSFIKYKDSTYSIFMFGYQKIIVLIFLLVTLLYWPTI